MFCNKCGIRLKSKSTFCHECGEKVDDNTYNSIKDISKKNIYIQKLKKFKYIITVIVVIGMLSTIILNYKNVLYKINISKANKATDVIEKINILNNAIKFKYTTAASASLYDNIMKLSKTNPEEGEKYCNSSKGNLSNVSYKEIMFEVNRVKINNSKDLEEKLKLCINALSFKDDVSITNMVIELIKEEIKLNPYNANEYINAIKDRVNLSPINSEISMMYLQKAKEFTKSDLAGKIKTYNYAAQFGYKLIDDREYINCLKQYIEEKLLNTYIKDDVSLKQSMGLKTSLDNYYSIGDLDNDKILEIIVIKQEKREKAAIAEIYEYKDYMYVVVDTSEEENKKSQAGFLDNIDKVTIIPSENSSIQIDSSYRANMETCIYRLENGKLKFIESKYRSNN